MPALSLSPARPPFLSSPHFLPAQKCYEYEQVFSLAPVGALQRVQAWHVQWEDKSDRAVMKTVECVGETQ